MTSSARFLIPILGALIALPGWAAQVTDVSPRGGQARALASSPRNPNLTIAVRSDGQLLRSTDAGASFVDVGVTIQAEPVHAGFDSSGVAFVATAFGVRVSRDSGQTWTQQPSTIGAIHSLAVSPVTLDQVWALTDDGVVHRSDDGGSTWTTLGMTAPPNPGSTNRLVLNPTVPSELYVTDSFRVWVSTDSGAQWTRMSFSGGSVMAFNAVGNRWVSTFIIGGHAPYVDIGYSTDRGATWSYPYVVSDSGSQVAPMDLWQDPARPGELHAYSLGAPTEYARSLDQGLTWTPAKIADQDLRLNAVAVPSGTGGRVLLSSRLGILAVDDPLENASRADLAQGDFLPLRIAEYSVSPTNVDHRIASYTGTASSGFNNGLPQMFLESTDAGATWSLEDQVEAEGGRFNLTSAVMDARGRILSVSSGRLLRRTSETWGVVDPGHSVSHFAFGTDDPDLMVVHGATASGECAWSVSVDDGATWTTQVGCGSLNLNNLKAIHLIERSGQPLRIAATVGSSFAGPATLLLVSDDLGGSFSFALDDSAGIALAQSAGNPERLAVGFGAARPVLISDDGLDTLVSSGAAVSASNLLIGGAQGELLVRVEDQQGMPDQVSESTDGGQTWATVTGLEGTVGQVFSLRFSPSEDAYFVSGSRGVLKRTLSPLVSSSYCSPAVPNSTGSGAVIRAIGSLSILANEIQLEASQLPAGAATLFLASQEAATVAGPGGSMGTLCLGGSIGRYAGDVKTANASGLAVLGLDTGALAQPNGSVPALAGASWNFQAWHRDAVAGVPTSNFTDGATLIWQP